MRQLDGKIGLVTGGSSGIGRATALALAREGATVVVAARGADRGATVAREITDAGGKATFVPADIGDSADVEALFSAVRQDYGRLDCAVNNAATEEGAFKLTADFSDEEFDRTVAVNLRGLWQCMKHELRLMLEQQPAGGAIVNTSSVNGLGGAPQGALYSASKAGVLALTKSAAQEYAPRGIRVNAFVPGAFMTPMLQRVFERAGGDPGAAEAVQAQYTRMIPLGRIGRPEEAAEAIAWLCSDAASYVVGHSLIVDGGLTAAVR